MNTAGLRGELRAAGGLRWEFILGGKYQNKMWSLRKVKTNDFISKENFVQLALMTHL